MSVHLCHSIFNHGVGTNATYITESSFLRFVHPALFARRISAPETRHRLGPGSVSFEILHTIYVLLVNRLRIQHAGGQEIFSGSDVERLTQILAGHATPPSALDAD